MLNGKLTHRRTINSKYGTSDIDWLREHVDPSANRYDGKPKCKYLLPLDADIAERIKPLSKIYLTCAASRDIAAPDLQSGEAGEAPSAALHPWSDSANDADSKHLLPEDLEYSSCVVSVVGFTFKLPHT